jgi:hypothetical protein
MTKVNGVPVRPDGEEELNGAEYAVALAHAYTVARMIKGLPLDKMEAMIRRAKLARPFPATIQEHYEQERFNQDALLVERLAAVKAAFLVLLPDLQPTKIAAAVQVAPPPKG